MLKNISFDFTDKPNLQIEDLSLKLRENGDFWRLHLDYCQSGKENELGVYSHEQIRPEVVKNDNEMIISYPYLVAEDKSVHNIKLELKITQKDGAIYFSADMDNNSDVRINELQYPFFEFNRVNGEFSDDEFVIPMGLGRKFANPHKSTKLCHTEYMAADYKNVWRMFAYPGDVSMPWMGVQSGDKYLYFGCHSEVWRQFSMLIGTEPRESDEEYVIYGFASYPVVRPGETLCYDGFVISAFDGDWRNGVDFYRKWTDDSWCKALQTRKAGSENLMGWQRIILKHQHGEIFHKYEDLPRIYREGAKYGINMILLFAWWVEGMDNGYPNYQPDPDLGGAEKLKEAIKEINSLGGIVILYANGHLIDVSTDYYKNEGYKYTMKDIELNEYREHYKFSKNGTLLKMVHGQKSFAGGCHGTEEWREKLLEIEKRHLSLGSNGTFFDQLGICFNPCFDDTHDHGNRIDLDPEMRLKTVGQMKSLLKEDEFIGTEWVVDRIALQMDFIHGCGFGQWFTEDAYPYIFRYAFPRVIISNRLIHDEKEGWKRHLNYAFTFGLIFDISIYRGRADSIEVVPNYAEYIKHLVEMRKKYLGFFTEGKFDIPHISIPENVKAAEYSLGEKKIVTVWNDSKADVEICGKTVAPQAVDVIEIV